MKRLIVFICFLLACMLLFANVFAAPPAVIDNADLLSDTEQNALESASYRVRERGYDVVILTMTGSYGGKSAVAYADDYFDYNGYGIGTDHTGVLLLINMTERDLYLSTSGKATRALTDRSIDMLLDDIAPYLSEGDYYRGLSLFISELDSYITAYEEGNDADYLGAAAVCLVIGLVIALLITLGMKNGMNTARLSRDAVYAINRDSFRLSKQRDIYLYSRTRRIPRNDSSSGGSSTHRSSSGRSHGGGGRKF